MSKPAQKMGPETRCPICRKPVVAAHAPFCSTACRDRDLIAWLDERYIVPGKPGGEDIEDG